MPRLFINSIEFELSEGQKIAQTKQVNDLVSLSTRQSNYTTTITLPLTANNVRGMNSLGIVGNNSNVPYQRNSCYYYSDSGECFIYDGWAIINSTSKGYNLNIYDGSIDFYKAIENTTLSELDLTEINHTKTLENVVASFNDETVYKYIIADYNGKALYDTNKINIDYLVPSVPVSYLWDKIFDTYGFTYSGSVFNTFSFINLWMSFPKGISNEDLEPELYYNNNDFTAEANGADNFAPIVHTTPLPITGSFLSGNINYLIPTDGTYVFNQNLDFDVIFEDIYGTLTYNENYYIYLTINNGYPLTRYLLNSSTDLYLPLIEGDLVSFIIQSVRLDGNIFDAQFNSGEISISFLDGDVIDFNASLIDFKTKDFVNEIIWRFGLTPYKDKYSNNIEFLTLQEVLQTDSIEDWSDKFNSLDNEKYIYGNYAQENELSYKYNDEQSDYYNGTLLIQNENLEDSRTVIASKIYAPEKERTLVFEKLTNVYKLWDKEPNDDGTVKYKSLDKRFYFMRYEDYYFNTTTTVGSETLITEQTTAFAPFESYFKLPFNDIVTDYYNPIYQILNDSQIVELTLFLNEIDVQNIDFKKLYYFKQLSNYYLLNKINNFTEKGLVKCEFIRVKYMPVQLDINGFPLTLSFADTCFTIDGFEDYTNLSFQFSTDGGVTWTTGATFISSNPSCGYVNVSGFDTLFRVINIVGEVVSNTILIPA